MLTLKEFKATKKYVDNLPERIGLEVNPEGLIYENDYYIEIEDQRNYMLTIGNDSEMSTHLDKLEIKLYEFYKDNL